ncbi:TetR/AcrR family transcriptional regulator [Paenibacillus apiarius]|uniref:TetR/AcrR family transcriptional regulator n=1 Tax=Paenibacillus apiarius TaxID=46240 RepID=A0ABT4DYG4_9BACL|nr:TetR/AcrR family transcriptional regulator [Paenibacillus apiarius]MCY9517461.1 TetR/AcrR family transcriptional regulator [Paenibacillus apiarius]MCY9522260.1 TetR/AcrR family transcriptional regulator [Paenibacillus apiarius]MCY9552294.1 TetR/AcrR family transcriptional regulator [Paenibacillus apiarius]MCY9560173.1 TetR/AcrR family transcriptional regulator [Paenibacillus apiarius]MCY9683791.1 TetR/AcrR family transcriptional regulator [Paenibacillus apiarius]
MSKKTEDKILKHATSLFFQYGYSAVSVDDLVKGIGMSKATLYRYYASKYDLLEMVIENMFLEIKHDISELSASELDPLQKLRTFMTLMTQRLSAIERSALEDIKESVAVLHDKFTRLRKEVIIHHLVKILEDGGRQGVFRQEIDQQVVAYIIFASIEELTSTEFLAHHSYRFSDVFDMVLSTVMYGNVVNEAGQR